MNKFIERASVIKYAFYPVLWALFIVGSLLSFIFSGIQEAWKKWF